MAERSFTSSRRSVREARRYVARELASLPEDVRDAALVLTSELCTNALLHGGSGFTLSVTCTSNVLRIAVTDPSDGQPHLLHPRDADLHGRGLQLVTALSDRWGVDPGVDDPGKTVWVELDLASPP